MIFVTVGTHEQPFDRLVSYVDKLCLSGQITEPVFIQTGYSAYKPEYCEWKSMLGYEEMLERMSKARVVVIHAGAGSYMMARQMGHMPVVVPRQKRYREHVDENQMNFAGWLAERNEARVVYDMDDLLAAIEYATTLKDADDAHESRVKAFNMRLEREVNTLFSMMDGRARLPGGRAAWSERRARHG